MAFQNTITRVNGQPFHYWERFQIAYHMGSGISPYQIASALSIAPKTAYKWIGDLRKRVKCRSILLTFVFKQKKSKNTF